MTEEEKKKISEFKEKIKKLGSGEKGTSIDDIKKEIEKLHNELYNAHNNEVDSSRFIHQDQESPTILETAINTLGDKIIPSYNKENQLQKDENFEFIKFLINKDGGINAENSEGKTPLEYAMNRSDQGVGKKLVTKLIVEYSESIELEGEAVKTFENYAKSLGDDDSLGKQILNFVEVAEEAQKKEEESRRKQDEIDAEKQSKKKKRDAEVGKTKNNVGTNYFDDNSEDSESKERLSYKSGEMSESQVSRGSVTNTSDMSSMIKLQKDEPKQGFWKKVLNGFKNVLKGFVNFVTRPFKREPAVEYNESIMSDYVLIGKDGKSIDTENSLSDSKKMTKNLSESKSDQILPPRVAQNSCSNSKGGPGVRGGS